MMRPPNADDVPRCVTPNAEGGRDAVFEEFVAKSHHEHRCTTRDVIANSLL